MRCRVLGGWLVGLLAAGLFAALAPSAVWAQTSSGTGSSGSISGNAAAGVSIDADGVLRTKIFADPGGQLMRERIAAARATLDPKVTAGSRLRKVSLNRLEQAILDHESTLTDEMRYLAGLLRVRYVFYYPDSKDIVLAGPAEGWVPDPSGRIVGLTTRAARRAVAGPGRRPAGVSAGRQGHFADRLLDRSDARRVWPDCRTSCGATGPTRISPNRSSKRMRNSRGLDLVRVDGVSPKTHFARVAVEADYRMKLIGIGLERPPVKLVSYVDRAKRAAAAAPCSVGTSCPTTSASARATTSLAMELVGDGVKLVGEDELVTARRPTETAASRGDKASQAFVASFTKKYPELAERSPVYAELRNLIDLAVAAAYIQQQDYYAKAGWKMRFLRQREGVSRSRSTTFPRWSRRRSTPIWKGNTPDDARSPAAWRFSAAEALESENLLARQEGQGVASSAPRSSPSWPRASGGGINVPALSPCVLAAGWGDC